MLSRETGQSRVPAPPHITTGITEIEFITAVVGGLSGAPEVISRT
jgi:hypothetical protein